MGFVRFMFLGKSFALSGGVSGANFTTTNPAFDRKTPKTKLCLHGQDGDVVINCNIYGAKPYVWLNGGPLTAVGDPGPEEET